MQHSPYIDECCAALEQGNEFSTDVCLVKLVRSQALLRKIEQSLLSNDLEPLWSPMTPVKMVLNALEAEVAQIFTVDTQTNSKLLYHSTPLSRGLC